MCVTSSPLENELLKTVSTTSHQKNEVLGETLTHCQYLLAVVTNLCKADACNIMLPLCGSGQD